MITWADCQMRGDELDNLRSVFEAAKGRWQGCDWPTHFGAYGIDLCGLKSSQAQLMSRATSGVESQAWRAAFDWLSQVEYDASAAEQEAAVAVDLARSGDFQAASAHADSACCLEKQYRKTAVWQHFCDLLQSLTNRLGEAGAKIS